MVGRSLKLVVLSILIAVSMVLCVPFALDSDRKETAKQSSAYADLTVGFLRGIDSLNPFVGFNDVSYIFYGLVYDTLTCIGNDLEAVPNLAASYYPVPLSDPEMVGMPYGSIWQYNLSHDARWSDGEPFSAYDVIYNVWLNAEVTHYDSMWAFQPYSYFMHQAWMIDEYTVRISFWDRASGEPMPASYAYQLSIPMLPKHLLELFSFWYIGMDWTGVFNETLSPGMPIVGTGPFIATPDIYSEWLAGDHITLSRNPDCHWESDYGKAINFNRLILRFYDDSTNMTLALKNGDIDAASYPPTAFDAIESDISSGVLENVTAFDGPRVDQYFTQVGFCMKNAGPNPSRLDPVIRQALHMATNKQYIVDNYYLGHAEVGTTLIAPRDTFWHYEPSPSEMIYYNLPSAAELLEDNGYVDGDSDGIRECSLSSPAVQLGYVEVGKELSYEMLVRKEYPEEKDTALYLKAQWSSIGVDLKVSIVDELTLSGAAYSYNYDTVLWYWCGDIDPNFLLFPQSQRAWNAWSDNRYFNPSYEENYTMSVSTIDPAERRTYVDNCQRTFYNDSAYIITAYTNQTYAWRTDTFTGWGDWSADPGRSLDNFWTGNPLFFDLMPIDINPPEVVASADPNPADLGSTVTLNGSLSIDNWEISDYNWTFEYDAIPQELHGKVVEFMFSTPGTYMITLNCTDPAGNFNTTTIELVVNPLIPEFGYLPAVVIVFVAMFVVAGRLMRREG